MPGCFLRSAVALGIPRHRRSPRRREPPSPRELIPKAHRELVTERAESRCEYCRAPQIVTGVTYHVEHIIPQALGGHDDPANYALSCVTCNGHKSAHITGIDPQTSEEVNLFHPRRDRWSRHFRFAPDTLELRALTATGRATIARLQMNEPKQIAARRLWVELEIYP